MPNEMLDRLTLLTLLTLTEKAGRQILLIIIPSKFGGTSTAGVVASKGFVIGTLADITVTRAVDLWWCASIEWRTAICAGNVDLIQSGIGDITKVISLCRPRFARCRKKSEGGCDDGQGQHQKCREDDALSHGLACIKDSPLDSGDVVNCSISG